MIKKTNISKTCVGYEYGICAQYMLIVIGSIVNNVEKMSLIVKEKDKRYIV